MSPSHDDPLWEEFVPLWEAMRAAHPPVILAGGYGLFLKQRSALERQDELIAVPLARWLSFAPRATKDLDILIGLEVIADEEQLAVIGRALRQCGFIEKQPRWQFVKHLPGDRKVLVDIHAPEPPADHPHVVAARPRVKNTLARGPDRVHGRFNPEAIGAHLHPCDVHWDGITVIVPNPLTWAVMKVTAAAERWEQSQNPDRTPEERTEQRLQAYKHAADAGRVVALMGVAERDAVEQIQAAVTGSAAYSRACLMRREHFDGAGFALPVLRDVWGADDVTVIVRLLSRWLP